MANLLNNKPLLDLPAVTGFGSLSKYITSAEVDNFNPMNVNFGIFEPLGINVRKSERKDEYVRRSLEVIEKYKKEYLDD